jgi:hypothetical protein
MVGQVLATRMNSEDVRTALVGQGVSDEYVVSPSNDFGGAGQIINVSGIGATPEAAAHASDVIVTRMTEELRSMQKVYGAVDRYMITLIPIQAPGEAKRVVSGQLRSVIALGGVGMILLFAAISVRQAMSARPRRTPESPGGSQGGSPRRRPRPRPQGEVHSGSSETPSLASAHPSREQVLRLVGTRGPSAVAAGDDLAPVRGLHRHDTSRIDDDEEPPSAPPLAQ